MKNEQDAAYWSAQAVAVRYVERRLRTAEEVRRKLSEKDFEADTINQVLAFLMRYDYVNDDTYCRAYIRDSARFHPKGRRRLLRELTGRGVARHVAETALDQELLDEEDAAYRLLCKKIAHPEELTPKERQKAVSFLIRRGYSWQVVENAFARMEENH